MKLKTKLLLSLATLSFVAVSNGAVTISFNAPFLGGMSSNLATQGGTVSNGLTWGIIVDGTGNGFLNTYDGLVNGAALLSSSVATDDYYFLGGLTEDSGQGGTVLESDFVTTGGNGGVGSVIFNLTGTATANDAFLLIWVDGNKVGTLADASFIVAADGAIVTQDAPFVGVDPVRSAGLAYSGTNPVSTGPGITIIPEPSAVLLGALGALGLLRRRRI
jgi:MYXO-CTERM domain-containing protein